MSLKRYVTATGKNRNRDITALCNPEESWSRISKDAAIKEIERGDYQYWVRSDSGCETRIHVLNGPNGKYLRTDRDNTPKTNLDDLPDC